MVHPGELVSPGDRLGALFAAAAAFIHCFQVIADGGSGSAT
jgi:hypothetical protein